MECCSPPSRVYQTRSSPRYTVKQTSVDQSNARRPSPGLQPNTHTHTHTHTHVCSFLLPTDSEEAPLRTDHLADAPAFPLPPSTRVQTNNPTSPFLIWLLPLYSFCFSIVVIFSSLWRLTLTKSEWTAEFLGQQFPCPPSPVSWLP